jgi:hypothetical protein
LLLVVDSTQYYSDGLLNQFGRPRRRRIERSSGFGGWHRHVESIRQRCAWQDLNERFSLDYNQSRPAQSEMSVDRNVTVRRRAASSEQQGGG